MRLWIIILVVFIISGCGIEKTGEAITAYDESDASGAEDSGSLSGSGCGNGIIEGMEVCDDGNTNFGDGCSSICEIESGWICSGEPSECRRRDR